MATLAFVLVMIDTVLVGLVCLCVPCILGITFCCMKEAFASLIKAAADANPHTRPNSRTRRKKVR